MSFAASCSSSLFLVVVWGLVLSKNLDVSQSSQTWRNDEIPINWCAAEHTQSYAIFRSPVLRVGYGRNHGRSSEILKSPCCCSAGPCRLFSDDRYGFALGGGTGRPGRSSFLHRCGWAGAFLFIKLFRNLLVQCTTLTPCTLEWNSLAPRRGEYALIHHLWCFLTPFYHRVPHISFSPGFIPGTQFMTISVEATRTSLITSLSFFIKTLDVESIILELIWSHSDPQVLIDHCNVSRSFFLSDISSY